MKKATTNASEEMLMAQLYERDWEEMWKILLARSFYILRKRYDVKWRNSEVQKFCRQIIAEVVDKIFLTRERNWNIDRYPDFQEFIIGVIDSHINNTLNKQKKEVTTEDESAPDTNQLDAQEVMVANELHDQIYSELQKTGASDEELLVFECLADGLEKPRDIREELGITEEEFHNIWRKFKRRRTVVRKILLENGY